MILRRGPGSSAIIALAYPTLSSCTKETSSQPGTLVVERQFIAHDPTSATSFSRCRFLLPSPTLTPDVQKSHAALSTDLGRARFLDKRPIARTTRTAPARPILRSNPHARLAVQARHFALFSNTISPRPLARGSGPRRKRKRH